MELINDGKKRFIIAQLVKSGAGRHKNQRQTLIGLGLKRMGQKVKLLYNNSVLGQLRCVNHLIKIEVVEQE